MTGCYYHTDNGCTLSMSFLRPCVIIVLFPFIAQRSSSPSGGRDSKQMQMYYPQQQLFVFKLTPEMSPQNILELNTRINSGFIANTNGFNNYCL